MARTGLLDGDAAPVLDRLARLAQRLLDAPVGLVSLVGEHAQHFPGMAGLTGWPADGRGTPIAYSLCRRVVEADAPVVLDDTRREPGLACHPAVTELEIAAYCGVPIRDAAGHVLGSVCAADGRARAWTARDVAVLGELADAAAEEFALRSAARHLEAREATLAERTRELEALFAAMHDLVLVIDGDGTYRRVVPTAPELLYRPAADIVGRRIHDVFPAPNADRFLATIRRALGTGRPASLEYALDLPGRGATRFEGVASPLDADAGTVLWVARDVTARAVAEDALRASEDRFRAISAASPVGIFHATLDGWVTYANPRLAEIWGAEPEALHGLCWLDGVHPDDVDAVVAGWTAANAAGREFAMQYRLLVGAPNGPGGAPDAARRVRWVHGRSAVIRDAAGAPVGSVGTVEDVTARVEGEAAAARLTAILEAMPDVVATMTPAGAFEYLNAAGRRLLGVAGGPEAVPAAGLTLAAVQPRLAPGGAQRDAVAAAAQGGLWRGETALTKADGQEIPVEQVLLAHRAPAHAPPHAPPHGLPSGPDGGAVVYLSSVLRDITERKHVEATLRAFALVDELTGLYNRRGFLSLAEQEWQRARAAGDGVVVLYLDLDGFKPINDTHGHAEGDRALAAFADVLRRSVRERDVVGRLGGDEFVLLARSGPGQPARDTAARLRARFAEQLAAANAAAGAAGRPYRLASSVGAAEAAAGTVGADAAPSLAALMTRADAALYDEKHAGRAGRLAAA